MYDKIYLDWNPKSYTEGQQIYQKYYKMQEWTDEDEGRFEMIWDEW